MQLIRTKQNIFGDNIANVEHYNFSQANLNSDSRLQAVTTVASICYQSPKAINSESLYNRLLREGAGLPSSAFEFVPILLVDSEFDRVLDKCSPENGIPNFIKFGEILSPRAILTNLRALIEDLGEEAVDGDYFNTPEECLIIAQHFKVFRFKVDMATRTQMIRHRISWQELSRRYVSGAKHPFEFYIPEKMQKITSYTTTKGMIDYALAHYDAAIAKGVKPQTARSILPQCTYTEIWGAFQPKQLSNFFKLRLDAHAQWEIRQVAEAMKELI